MSGESTSMRVSISILSDYPRLEVEEEEVEDPYVDD